MLNINLNNVKANFATCDDKKNEAYEKLKSFKNKNKELKAKYVAQGQTRAKIVL